MLGEQQCDRISGGQERQLLDSIRLEQQRIRKIEIAMRDFKESTIETHYNVTIKSVPGCKILSLRKLWQIIIVKVGFGNSSMPL